MTAERFDFSTPEVSEGDIKSFCVDRVNLPPERAKEYREKVGILRDHLERYLVEHEDVGLAKMLLSGSLAKGTALRTLNDVDVAVYIKGEKAPSEFAQILEWLVERLQKTYHQIDPKDIYIDDPCVVVNYSNIRVEVAPILYLGDPQWKGYLWDRRTREKILTSIPLHKDFIQKRKERNPDHFAQAIRLLKWWARQREKDTNNFRARSFLVELLMAKISDDKKVSDSLHATLENFFLYILKSQLKERIAFTDNYKLTELPARTNGVEIFDPVNATNNVASDMTDIERKALVDCAESSLDALSYAVSCQTKKEAIECWKEVMGATFTA